MFWESLQTFSDATVYFVCAVSATLLFLIRLALALFGGDGGDLGDSAGGDAGHHGDSTGAFKLFSLLSILAFFMGAGWMGLAARVDWELSGPVSMLLALGFGVLLMLLASGLSMLVKRLGYEPKVDLSRCVGAKGQVYLTIPAKGAGQGRVTVTLGGVQRTLSATSTGPELPAFSAVQVVSIDADWSVVVEPV